MTRLLAIDYGTKRVGLAVSDPLQIIATGLATVPTETIFDYLKSYLFTESVSTFVIGMPMHLDGSPAQLSDEIENFATKLRQQYPDIEVVYEDERFTSEDAKQIIRQSGAKKKKRQDKTLVDKVAAVLILQHYMERRRGGF
jgi:putative holliday junction resolvase